MNNKTKKTFKKGNICMNIKCLNLFITELSN